MNNDDIASLCKALADENRIEILRTIAKEPGITANELLKTLHIAQSTLSHHMHVLTASGVVRVQRQGKWSHYSISPEALDVLDHFVNGLRINRSQRARRIRMLNDIKRDAALDERLADAVDEIIEKLN